MRATLRFNLDDPDDRVAHLRCTKALAAYGALYDIVNYLRKVDRESEGGEPLWEEINRDLLEIIDSSGVDLSVEYT